MSHLRKIFYLLIQWSIIYLLLVTSDIENLSDYKRLAVRRAPGTVVPRPASIVTSEKILQVDPSDFRIVWSAPNPNCDIINKAIKRYTEDILIFDDTSSLFKRERKQNILNSLQLIISQPKNGNFVCEDWPHEDMEESYSLSIRASNRSDQAPMAALTSSSCWGFLRGLETFSQLVFRLIGTPLDAPWFGINETSITDGPRFRFRGFMLDTARHYIPLDIIRRNLDAMAYNKLNVFHWHIVDDQSFPYVSKRFPQLSNIGAFGPSMIYTPTDVADIIDYARLRGIRVIPEFDTPGHSYGMRGIPGLLTECYGPDKKPNGDVGPIDPIHSRAYTFINKLLEELSQVFPDRYFHAGGDEVDFGCWQSNPKILDWMTKHNTTSMKDVEGHYIDRLLNMIMYHKKVPMVWQEVFDNGVPLRSGTIVHVWKYLNDPVGYFAEMTKVTQAGHVAVLSSCWYLNIISYGQDWVKFYQCDPQDFIGTKAQYDRVLGGEACLWSEYVDETNLLARSWPRGSTTAERLWSPREVRSLGDFAARVEQLRCRLRSRGISAEPIVGPGHC